MLALASKHDTDRRQSREPISRRLRAQRQQQHRRWARRQSRLTGRPRGRVRTEDRLDVVRLGWTAGCDRGERLDPHKALRRVQDHLLDHLAEVEALLAGASTIPDTWYGRTVTIDADWARFTEADLAETQSRLSRLAQLYELRFAAAGPAEWDRPRTQPGRFARSRSTLLRSPGTPIRSAHSLD
jgi:hypothetical protein